MLATFTLAAHLFLTMLPTNALNTQLCMPRSNGQRLFSASFAFGISLLFLAQLHFDVLRIRKTPVNGLTRMMLIDFSAKEKVRKISALPTPNTTSTNTNNKIDSIHKKRLQNTTPKLASPKSTAEPVAKNNIESQSSTELIKIFPDSPSNTAASKSSDSVSDSLSDPLSKTTRYRIDSAAVRQAYEASKSDIQKLAEKSGTSLEDPKLSKHDRFQQAANRAAKPDCLRQGGSILSLFVVAYQVATDHCK